MLRILARIVFVPLLLLSCHGGGSGGGGNTVFDAQKQVGTWTGTWHNTTFSTTGPVTATVTLNNGTYNIAFDMGGSVFGGTDPALENYTAAVTSSNATLTAVTSPVYGSLTGTVDANGNITAGGTNIPGSVSSFALTGTWTATQITANVVITFDNSNTANANATLTKQ